ncbi:Mur ligase family protein, partial [Macromonas nakdongensis]|uniref:Mur ligase family protein n=1 Tax=Macromonas nakdongensis TaxID=1843082 RepID=UPI001E43D41F
MQTLHTPAEAVAWLRQRGVRQLVCDSRHLQPGDAFVAWPGAAQDGRRYVEPALRAGAAACLVEQDGAEAWPFDDARIAAVPGLKALAGALAAAFYATPSADVRVVAITGTNGKTSTAWWTAQWLAGVGTQAAVMGTLGIGVPGQAFDATGLTTPDPVRVQAALRQLHGTGVRACVVEASSIGLQEGRLNGMAVHTSVFTNFTQDHLDYHGSMAAYWQAKRALFDWPGLRAAVVNLDDPQGPGLARELADRDLALWTVSVAGTPDPQGAPARLRVTERRWTTQGLAFTVEEAGGDRATLALPVVGDYNVANLLCALAVLRAQGHT